MCTDSDCGSGEFADLQKIQNVHKLICYLVRRCEEQLNATLTSQEYTITSSDDTQFCSYVITTQPGSGVEATITDGASVGTRCGDVTVLFDRGK